MASTTQKKSTKASAAKKSGGSRSKKQPPQPQKRPIRREVWGVILLVLTLCTVVSYFRISAIFLDWFAALLKGLFGYGYYLAGPAMLLASLILLFHHGRPVRLRTACALLLPVMFGILGHILFCKETFESSLGVLPKLWTSGNALASGGVISGTLAIGSSAVFSPLVSLIVFIVLFVVLLMVALRLTVGAILEKHRERPQYEEEPEEPHIRMVPLETPKRRTEEPVSPRKEKTNTAREVAAQTAAVTAEIEEKLASGEDTYQFPPITLLRASRGENFTEAGAELRNNSRRLAETLTSFGVDATPGDVIHGPSVTRYEFVLDQGVKLSKLTNLADDIALALGATGVRIAPIPDKISVVGIEVPNKHVTPVFIRDVIESRDFTEHRSKTAFALGRDIAGRNVIGDIEKLPHVLIAGTTGSGKSVCTNSLIISLLYKSTPDEVRFIMVDPKMVELAPYNGIPHLLIPVVTDPKKAAGALQWAVFEMMKRYKTFSENGVKKLEEYNKLARATEGMETLPSVVVVIDELADLMLVAAKEVEESICRVAQMGRAAGVHLVIATQRPSADVITGLMKANIPSRIAFAVASSLESRIILDNTGAEKLVGKGDMLYAPLGAGKPTRVQGCFISPEEIEQVVEFVKQSGEAHYSDEVIAKIEESVQEKEKGGSKGGPAAADSGEDEGDELLPAAVEVVLETGQASVSMLQRRLKLGYSRAARLVDQMEERGIVGPFEGSKPRQLLITRAQWQEMQMGGAPNSGDEEPPFPEEEP